MKRLFVRSLAAAAFFVLLCAAAVYADGSGHKVLSATKEESVMALPASVRAYSSAPRISIEGAAVTGIKDRTYTGDHLIPSVKVYIKSGGKKILLKKDKDYTVLTSHTKNVGTANVTIRGIGAYKGSVKRTFQITPARIRAASLKYSSLVYTGEARTQTRGITVKARLNKQPVTLTRGKDYTVSYKKNTKVGTAYVIIRGTGNFTGRIEKTFKIVPQTTEITDIAFGPGRISVKWTKQGVQTTGYQLQCSRNSSFTETVKTFTIKDKSKLSKTVKGLSAGQKYFLRIRTYKTVGEKKYYSDWSSARKAVILNNIKISGSGSVRKITVYNPKDSYKSMKAAVWSEEGGQDDLKWYAMTKKNGAWTVSVPLAALKHGGSCNVHVYNGRTFLKSASFKCTLRNTAVNWDSSWEFAGNSAVHSGSAYLYRAVKNRKGIIVGVNAGHGTGDYVHYVYSHPDHTPKTTGGSTATGSVYTMCDNYGMCFNDGAAEHAVALRQAEILKDLLLKNGYDVLMLRTDSSCALDVIARTVICNNIADCHIALHWDGENFSYDKGCFYTSVPGGIKKMYPVSTVWKNSEKLGKCLIEGLRGRGLAVFETGAMDIDLMQTSYSSIPSVDLELGNQCSPHSDKRLTTNARGILDGLNAYYSG